MNPYSVLLRLLLVVVLVLNGTGTAAASVTMPAGMAGSAPTEIAVAPETAGAQAEMPCHEMAAEAVSPDMAATQASAHHPSDDGQPAAPDCCKTGACHCACMQAAQAALPAMPAFGFVPPHSDVPHPMYLGHAEPALPHLVRPPIG